MMLQLPVERILALLVAVSFAAGLNVYATVATLGLLAHTGRFPLPEGLSPLGNWYVIAASLVLFCVEFFGDKIPAFDLLWNALHTFIRIPIAALLAFRATASLPPWEQLLATLAGGLIAFAAHGGKTAARVAVTPSPEPLSNIGLSLGEDAVAITLTWIATEHPYIAAAVALCFCAAIAFLMRWVMQALRSLFHGARTEIAEI
jgi:Domain of unknown function (DUF4126)